MMFYFFTSPLLLVTLLSVQLPSAEGVCLPCQARFSDELYPGLARRGVYNPKIKDPTASTTWVVGSHVPVTWELNDMPKEITNTKGKIFLGMLKKGSDNEHLDLKNPLADGFDIRLGKIMITVPKVDPSNSYIIVLFGDSGNRSPAFRIKSIST